MILTDLKIHHLRNLSSTHLSLNSRFNFIVGPNGSGKTSILEALYILSCGHSFRSREISPIVSHGESTLTIFAKSLSQDTISIQKSCSEPTQIKLNNQYCTSTSQLAYALPCQVFYSDIFQIIDAGPSVRRAVLDWGLFHVKPNYLSLLKEYKKVLKQRNALLKMHAPYSHFVPWDNQLSSLADEINLLREDYFSLWQVSFARILQELTDINCSITYYKGWDKKNCGHSLKDILANYFEQDNQRLFTQYGAHQADVIIDCEHTKAKHYLSRGQQKIILFALKLAQSELLDHECMYLVDDFAAELDEIHQMKLLKYFLGRKGQYFITTNTSLLATNQLISSESAATFHINNGHVNA
ncbi:DNA replication/repair protein RecF [Legionella fallonii]|uniref:DNA replication and repair protein RecF n=1 Tax=Legionella fallonii LLAP-10 TaxID=1212491 RepID=A0A098G0K3_9GAMM|nr:DNA replication/repair protein RecF [Legionella fallonii]CEG55491.1 DNA replication and repair protein RecF [Legionella fallonii LLAP-10]